MKQILKINEERQTNPEECMKIRQKGKINTVQTIKYMGEENYYDFN